MLVKILTLEYLTVVDRRGNVNGNTEYQFYP